MQFKKKSSVILLAIVLLSLFISVVVVNRKAFYFLFTEATGTKANLIIETTGRYGEGPFIWKNLAQGGEENNPLSLVVVKDQVKELQPEYIRIDHIYDFYEVVKRREDGSIFYDWSKLDQVVDTILQTGAKPFFSLSYMPSILSSGSETDLPHNWNDWQSLVRETVNHYSGKNNKAIEGVYYEVWNEPDLFGGFKTSGDKNYLTLYYHAARGAQAASNTLPYKIGGPATTNYYKNWMEGLFVFATENSLPVDFISWHQYSPNMDDFEINIKTADDLLANYPEFNSEVLITEWGHNSNIDAGYDGYFSAIHTLAGVTLMESMSKNTSLEPLIDKAFLFEIKDGPGPEQFWGRWGLYTHERYGPPVAKTRERAIRFLNRMEGEKLKVLGQGSWVKAFAKADEKTIRLMVTNYDVSGKHTEVVPIRFINLAPGSYTLNRIDFNGTRRTTEIVVESNIWEMEEHFAPNTAAIFELSHLEE